MMEAPVRDPQAAVFNKRLKRIDRIHRRGGGFEADGTLGQSFYTRRQRRRSRRGLRAMLYMAGVVFGAKALLIADLGTSEYLQRVSNLEAGSTAEQIGAFFMQADPITLWLAQLLAPLFGT